MNDNNKNNENKSEDNLWDPPQPAPHNGRRTSREAAKAIEPSRLQIREQVFQCIESAGNKGLSDREVQELLGLNGDCQRPRRRELEKAGRVECVGEEIRSPSRKTAMIWCATDRSDNAS